MKTKHALTAALAASAMTLSGCAVASMTGEEFTRAIKGSEATFRTYDKQGHVMDDVHGTSLRVTRDETFDEAQPDGSTKKGSMVLVQVGSKEVRHVGSTATLIQDGVDIAQAADAGQEINSTENATPVIQKIMAHHENMWKGSAKTVLVRTQDDVPVAVLTGDEVEMFAPDIPNATALRIVDDGKARYALIYRSNLTVYDTDLVAPKGK